MVPGSTYCVLGVVFGRTISHTAASIAITAAAIWLAMRAFLPYHDLTRTTGIHG